MNEQPDDEDKITPDEQTRFIGSQACPDSLGLAGLIVVAEELIADKFGKTVQLTSDTAFSQGRSPFRSPETLTDYIRTIR